MQVCHDKEKFQSYPKVIIDFCGSFAIKCLLSYHWVGLNPFGHLAIEFFDKEVGFSWKAYRDFSTRYTYADSTMGPFMAIAGITTPLVAYDERSITYLTTTNTGLQPYVNDEAIRYVHYFVHR